MLLPHHRLSTLTSLALILPTVVVNSLRRPPSISTLSWPVVIQEQSPTTGNQQHKSDEEQRRTQSSSSSVPLPTPDDHLVTSLPLLNNDDFPTKHFAGHIPATSLDRQIFYWLFEPSSDAKNAPLLIWLNGGPGCSSMDGLFLENGPFRLAAVDKDWKIGISPHSWHNAPAWTVYVDQPVGTGLSFTRDGRYCKNDEEVNEDFYAFLVNLLTAYSDYFLTDDLSSTNRPVFFAGESHAGHYIPSMMDYILQRNKDENKVFDITLGGAAIGNGWMDPYNQYAAATAAYGYGLIDMAQWAALNKQEEICQEKLKGGDLRPHICFSLLDDIINDSNGGVNYRVSVYDNRVWEVIHKPRVFPIGHKDIEAYLGSVGGNAHQSNPPMESGLSKRVLKAIHATEATVAGQYYLECTDPPYNALGHQDGKGVVPELVRILNHDNQIPMLFYNGMNDMMCNHVGNEVALDLLPWTHAKEWSHAKRFVWNGLNKQDVPAGYVKTFRNLSFLKIKDSGHMVPMDQPELSLEMMKIFLTGRSFQDKAQNSLERDGPLTVGACPACQECPKIENSPSNDTPVIDIIDKAANHNIPNDEDSSIEQHSSSYAPNDDDHSTRNFVIGGAWMGALLASFFVVFYLKRMRDMTALPFDQVDTSGEEMDGSGSDNSVDRYKDNPESIEIT